MAGAERRNDGSGPRVLLVALANDVGMDRIAAMGLGTRQRVARLLRALAARGLIFRGYGALEVPSLHRLEAFATL